MPLFFFSRFSVPYLRHHLQGRAQDAPQEATGRRCSRARAKKQSSGSTAGARALRFGVHQKQSTMRFFFSPSLFCKSESKPMACSNLDPRKPLGREARPSQGGLKKKGERARVLFRSLPSSLLFSTRRRRERARRRNFCSRLSLSLSLTFFPSFPFAPPIERPPCFCAGPPLPAPRRQPGGCLRRLPPALPP